jgi:hypothetical protein
MFKLNQTMKNLFKYSLFLSLFMVLSVITIESSAQNVIGKWAFDDIVLDLSATATPEQKTQYEASKAMFPFIIDMMKKSNMSLEFNKDGSMVSNSLNQEGKLETKTGKWRVEGDKLFMTPVDKEEESKYAVKMVSFLKLF